MCRSNDYHRDSERNQNNFVILRLEPVQNFSSAIARFVVFHFKSLKSFYSYDTRNFLKVRNHLRQVILVTN